MTNDEYANIENQKAEFTFMITMLVFENRKSSFEKFIRKS